LLLAADSNAQAAATPDLPHAVARKTTGKLLATCSTPKAKGQPNSTEKAW